MCSLFEAVLYSVPLSRVEALADEKHASGRILKRLRKKVNRPITAILTLNTIANTAGAAIAGAIAAKALGSAWVGIFSGVLTFVILFFSEIIPKTVGVVFARELAPVIARPLLVMVWIFMPFVWGASFVTRFFQSKDTEGEVSPEEILVMAKMGLRRGVIEKDEMEVIQNILALRDARVRQVMTPRTVLFTLSHDSTVADAAKNERLVSYSRIPVYFKDNEDIGGIVHRRDILAAVAQDRYDVRLSEIMKPVHFVLDKWRLNRVLKMFLERREHMFVVIDEYGGLSGVITLEDVLEEILGREIVDEFDHTVDLQTIAQKRREQILGEQSQTHGDEI
jgi:CBS domain containing-hemolysin-like protein